MKLRFAIFLSAFFSAALLILLSTASRSPVILAERSTPTTPTWNDVAPIFYANCTSCHRPHGNGPFSLLTYSDGRRWGPQIAQVTASRYMPPWLPVHGYGEFANERSLSNPGIATIAAWVKAGMPEGDAAKYPKPPALNDDWVGGKPDLILTVEQPFSLPAGGSDLFHNFILPFPLKQTRYIRAMEIRPSAPEVVHHANILIDRTASLRRLHPTNWQAGVDGMELNIDAGNTFDPDGHFLFWKPDTPVIAEVPGMPWQLDPGNDLVLNMHLKPSGKTTVVSAQIGLYFTPDPPSRQPVLLQLEHDDALDIPPGDAHFTVDDHLKLPEAVTVLGVYPHAHYLGKDLQAWAVLPDGSRRWLIWIRDWDIDRQAVYRFKNPVALPKGSTVYMHYTYDNSATNPHNPHLPPVRVKAGERSEDEMGHLWLQVLPEPVTGSAIDPRLALEEAWMRRRLEKTPDDSLARYNLASALEAEGQFGEAAKLYQAQLVTHPNDARFLNGLGSTLDMEGDWQQARRVYEHAVSSAPDNCDARFDLARLELKHDQPADAATEFHSILAHCPEDAAVHSGLAVALATQGQMAAAAEQFQRALQLDPDDFTANYSLGLQQRESGNMDAAITALSRAVWTNGHDLDAREQLALAFAQSGRMPDALAQLRAAVGIAPKDPDVHALFAQLLSSAGKAPEAIEQQKRSLQLRPDDADQWNNLGVMEARSGNRVAAQADFRHALALKPGDAEAHANLHRIEQRSVDTPSPR